jgi:hypothetical protein
MALTELLVSLPILAGVGLGALQVSQVMRWRIHLGYVVNEAARQGVLEHALPIGVEAGMARGLVPILGGASNSASYAVSLATAQAHVQVGLAAGWLQWRQLSPTPQSFVDWAVPAKDSAGNLIAGQSEIPIDNMASRIKHQQPQSGVAAFRGTESIGVSSGQTLNDASILKIEMTYWVPLQIPWVGQWAARLAQSTAGCTSFCAAYFAPNAQGVPTPRWPIRVTSSMRMQTPARRAGIAVVPTLGPQASLGTGVVDDASSFTPVGVAVLNPNGADAQSDGSQYRGPGFLSVGGQRTSNTMGACGIPP